MITCTITPPPDVLARLAACPALPRGDRLEWAMRMDMARPDNPSDLFAHSYRRSQRQSAEYDLFHNVHLWRYVRETACNTGLDRADYMVGDWKAMARPLRDARQRLREARTHARTLEQVCAQQKQRIQALGKELDAVEFPA